MAGTYLGDGKQCSLVGMYGTFVGVINVKARKLQQEHHLQDHECSIKKCVLISEQKETYWGIWGRRMFGTELTLRKVNFKGRVD